MIRVGTSGFSFEDWAGPVYPRPLRRNQWLPYYEHVLGFRILELNSSFYTLIGAPGVSSLMARTTPAFRFVLKAHRALTHGPTDGRILDRFRGTLDLFRSRGRLAGVLAQFPPSFLPTRASFERLETLHARLGDPLFVEFRNPGWSGTFVWRTLESMGLSWCAADLPPLRPLPPRAFVSTGGPAYVRLHGRNPDWFVRPERRYDYDYSDAELRALTEQVLALEESAGEVLVFFNNCHRGQAAKNARRLEELLATAALPGSATPGS
jgi:uncharacterized protein YecE (DUF72 family)